METTHCYILAGLGLGMALGALLIIWGIRSARGVRQRYALVRRVNGADYLWGWTVDRIAWRRRDGVWQPMYHRAYRYDRRTARLTARLVGGCAVLNLDTEEREEVAP